MTTNNQPETWTIARDDMGVIRAMPIEVIRTESERPVYAATVAGVHSFGRGPGDAIAHLDRALARHGRSPRAIDLLGVQLGPRYRVYIVGCRAERFYRWVNALGCYRALRGAGKDCRIIGDNADDRSDGLTEEEREQVEAVP